MTPAAEAERRRWLNWLDQIGYGIDSSSDFPPPCTVRELAEVMQRREPIPDDEGGVDAYVWCIGEETGWKDSS